MPSLALWGLFLQSSDWITGASTSTGGTGSPYGAKQLTSVGVHLATITVPKL